MRRRQQQNSRSNKRGFAAMPPEESKRISRKSGKISPREQDFNDNSKFDEESESGLSNRRNDEQDDAFHDSRNKREQNHHRDMKRGEQRRIASDSGRSRWDNDY